MPTGIDSKYRVIGSKNWLREIRSHIRTLNNRSNEKKWVRTEIEFDEINYSRRIGYSKTFPVQNQRFIVFFAFEWNANNKSRNLDLQGSELQTFFVCLCEDKNLVNIEDVPGWRGISFMGKTTSKKEQLFLRGDGFTKYKNGPSQEPHENIGTSNFKKHEERYQDIIITTQKLGTQVKFNPEAQTFFNQCVNQYNLQRIYEKHKELFEDLMNRPRQISSNQINADTRNITDIHIKLFTTS